VWTKGLLLKLRFLPALLLLTLKYFLTNHTFMVYCVDGVSHTHPIMGGIHQSSILALTLYNILPQINLIQKALTLLPSLMILLSFPPIQTLTNPQLFFRIIYLKFEVGFVFGELKKNESKTSHIAFTLRSIKSHSLSINNNIIPQ
jgi:hypothetical protein